MGKNVYEHCPVYETASFVLRLVELEDAPALLECYSKKENVAKMNADCCTSDFYYTTLEQMEQCIRFWLEEYRQGYYVRFAVVAKDTNRAVGTVEIFGGETGVLRIDLPSLYQEERYITEIVQLAVQTWIEDFGIGSLKIKTKNTPERVAYLERLGFVPSKTFRPEFGYHEYIGEG